MWGCWIGLGGVATDLAASIFPAARRTYLIVAEPGGWSGSGEAAAAVTTLRTWSSIFLATCATAAVTRAFSCSDMTGVTILVDPWSDTSSSESSSPLIFYRTLATSPSISVIFSLCRRSVSAADKGLSSVLVPTRSFAIVP